MTLRIKALARETTPVYLVLAEATPFNLVMGTPSRVARWVQDLQDLLKRSPLSPRPEPLDCDDWGTDAFFESATASEVTTCLEAGAETTIRPNQYGIAILHIATAITDDPEVIAVLVRAGADPDAEMNRPVGMRPLHLAASRGNEEIIEVLLEAGADVTAEFFVGTNVGGATPLTAARARGHESAAELL